MLTTLHKARTLLDKTHEDLVAAKKLAADAQREVNRLQAETKRLEAVLAGPGVIELAITDHAQLRYVERALGYDPTTLAEHIARDVEPLVRVLGDGSYPLGSGCVAVVKNRHVITVLPA
jgi:hypothetical protein